MSGSFRGLTGGHPVPDLRMGIQSTPGHVPNSWTPHPDEYQLFAAGEDTIFYESPLGPNHVIFKYENIRFLKRLATARTNFRGGHPHPPAAT